MFHTDRNKDLAVKQALAWAVAFGVGENSFMIFANHLKVPLWFYAALLWIPFFVGPLIQIVAANILGKYSKRILFIYVPVLIQASCFLPLGALALWQKEPSLGVITNHSYFVYFIFLITILFYYLSGQFLMPSWQSWLGDLVSENERGNFLGGLNRALYFVMLIAMAVVWYAFYFIEHTYIDKPYYFGYLFAICFFIAFMMRTTSGLLIKKLEELPYHPSEDSYFTFWQFIKRAPQSNFVQFVFFAATILFSANIAGPYFIDYWSGILHFSKAQWLVLQTAGTISVMLTVLLWGRFSDLFGNKRALKYSAFLLAPTPLLWVFVQNFYGLLAVHMISMVFWAGFNLCTINYVFEAASPSKRARCFAYYSIILGIGVLLGTQVGLALLKYVPKDLFGVDVRSNFIYALIAASSCMFVSCFLFLPKFKELREVETISFRSVWNNVFMFNNLFKFKNIKPKS